MPLSQCRKTIASDTPHDGVGLQPGVVPSCCEALPAATTAFGVGVLEHKLRSAQQPAHARNVSNRTQRQNCKAAAMRIHANSPCLRRAWGCRLIVQRQQRWQALLIVCPKIPSCSMIAALHGQRGCQRYQRGHTSYPAAALAHACNVQSHQQSNLHCECCVADDGNAHYSHIAPSDTVALQAGLVCWNAGRLSTA